MAMCGVVRFEVRFNIGGDDMDNEELRAQKTSARKFILRVLASWLAMIALDLLLNAGLFAKLWFEPSPFLLSPEDLFRRLPAG
jgi:hypothetical protein